MSFLHFIKAEVDLFSKKREKRNKEGRKEVNSFRRRKQRIKKESYLFIYIDKAPLKWN